MGKLSLKKDNLKRILALSGVILTTSLTGCMEKAITEDATAIYDVIDSNEGEVKIDPQVLDVEGEDFKLVVEYSLDPESAKQWKITSDKKLFMKVYTKDLPEDTKVYIDNVHTDTTIVSTSEEMNGITQDSMDDRIHNSLMYGFPINDETSLYATNEIEGQNDTFISGSSYGFNGYTSGTISQRRHSEEEYLKEGVYANKISSVYGLLIQKKDGQPYGVDVSSDVVALACNTIKKKTDDGKIKYYQYDREGNCQEISETKVMSKK